MKTQFLLKSLPIVTAVAMLSVSQPALAGSATASMPISATVTNNCTISANALTFGNYDPIVANASTPLTASTTLSVTCTKGSSPSVDLNIGTNAQTGDTTNRWLKSGANLLKYNLYQDATYATVWGSTLTGGTAEAVSNPTGAPQTLTVYARIPAASAQANVVAGSYTDTVVATINF